MQLHSTATPRTSAIAISFRFEPGLARSNRVWAMIGITFLLTLSVVVTRWPVRLGPVIGRAAGVCHSPLLAAVIAPGP